MDPRVPTRGPAGFGATFVSVGGFESATADRSKLWMAQTPQVFDAGWLKDGYAKLDTLDKSKITDDAQLIEALGQRLGPHYEAVLGRAEDWDDPDMQLLRAQLVGYSR